MTHNIKRVTLLYEKFPTGDHYPLNLPIFNQTRYLEFDTPVTLFVGDNGTGKSTLLEALARRSDIHIWSKPDGARYSIQPVRKTITQLPIPGMVERESDGSVFGVGNIQRFHT